MASVKRQAYEADFKLQAVSHAVECGNRAAERESNIGKSMVQKRRKQEVIRPNRVSEGNLCDFMSIIIWCALYSEK